MKTQPWIPVLAWAVLLSAAAGQARCQPRCAPGVIYRCTAAAELDKSKADGVETVREDRPTRQQTDWVVDKAVTTCEPKASVKAVQKRAVNCGPKTAVKCEPTCGILRPQMQVACEPAKGFAKAEPRKLALPHGSYKRLNACDAPKAASIWDGKKCGACKTDCRRDAIFGTETIFGDFSLLPFGDKNPCPYDCTGASRPKSPVQIFSKLDTSLQKVFVCHRGTAGSSSCKGTCDCQSKSKGKGDMGTAPILEGQPEQPEREANPFHDDAVELAPLPPLPKMTSKSSNANQVRQDRPPVKLGVAQAKPVSGHSISPLRQVDQRMTGTRTPQPIRDQARSAKSATPLLTSIQAD